MDEDSLRNWGYYDPPLKGHLGLQLMSSVVDRDTKPFPSGRENPFMVTSNVPFHPRDCLVPEPPVTHVDYVRDNWINHREKFLHMFPPNSFNPILTETLENQHSVPMPHQTDLTTKKRAVSATHKSPKVKKPRKGPASKENCSSSVHRAKTSKKSLDVVINGVDIDISGIPIPVCSCTGIPQQCYRWGCGGWQSACCTTTISMYPLPMSTKRRGARIAGRKMSQGAFKKVLEKLASEGYDITNPIDLRTYWAKHGTNKFVTIR